MKVEGNRYCCSDQCHKTTMHKWSKEDQCLVCQNCGSKKSVYRARREKPLPADAGMYMVTRNFYD